MEEICGGERLSHHLGQLLEFERPLESSCLVEAPAQHGADFHPGMRCGCLFCPAFLAEGMLDQGRQPVDAPGLAGHRVRDQCHHGQLGGICLGGGHRPLFTGVEVDDHIGTLSKGGVGLVGDCDGRPALFPALFENRNDVGRLTAL